MNRDVLSDRSACASECEGCDVVQQCLFTPCRRIEARDRSADPLDRGVPTLVFDSQGWADVEAFDRLRAENEALKANLSAVFDQAVEIHENPHPLMPFADYLRYRLGTVGHAYHVQGVADLIEERDIAARDADRRSCQGGWKLAQERAVRALKAEWEVERLRECLNAAGAKFHELDLPVYADACLRESRGASDESQAPACAACGCDYGTHPNPECDHYQHATDEGNAT